MKSIGVVVLTESAITFPLRDPSKPYTVVLNRKYCFMLKYFQIAQSNQQEYKGLKLW